MAREAKAEDAKKHLAAATALLDKGTNPEQAHFLYLAGYVAFYNGDYKGALAAFEKAGQRDPFIQPDRAGLREDRRPGEGDGDISQSSNLQYAQSNQCLCAAGGEKESGGR